MYLRCIRRGAPRTPRSKGADCRKRKVVRHGIDRGGTANGCFNCASHLPLGWLCVFVAIHSSRYVRRRKSPRRAVLQEFSPPSTGRSTHRALSTKHAERIRCGACWRSLLGFAVRAPWLLRCQRRQTLSSRGCPKGFVSHAPLMSSVRPQKCINYASPPQSKIKTSISFIAFCLRSLLGLRASRSKLFANLSNIR